MVLREAGRGDSPRYNHSSFSDILIKKSTLPESLCSTSSGMAVPLEATFHVFAHERHWTRSAKARGQESAKAKI